MTGGPWTLNRTTFRSPSTEIFETRSPLWGVVTASLSPAPAKVSTPLGKKPWVSTTDDSLISTLLHPSSPTRWLQSARRPRGSVSLPAYSASASTGIRCSSTSASTAPPAAPHWGAPLCTAGGPPQGRHGPLLPPSLGMPL
ncbi:unnamed protein product [Lampetra fluviatilis]